MYVFVAPEYLPIICLACCIGGKISEIEGRVASINGLVYIQGNENSSKVSPRVQLPNVYTQGGHMWTFGMDFQDCGP